MDAAHPLHPGPVGGEVPLDQVGTRAQVRGRDGGADLSAGLCGHQALLTHDGAHRVAVHHHAPAPQGRGDAPVPVGSVRGAELSPDEKGQSASSGGSRRLRPAAPAVVAGPQVLRPTGTSARPGSCAPVGEWSRTLRVTSAPSRSTPLLFLGTRITTPGVAQLGAQPPDLSRLTAETLLILGGGMIPAVPAHPVPHGLGRQTTEKQTPTRSSGPSPRSHAQPAPRAHPSTSLST
mgnify:CR=1 FL=1